MGNLNCLRWNEVSSMLKYTDCNPLRLDGVCVIINILLRLYIVLFASVRQCFIAVTIIYIFYHFVIVIYTLLYFQLRIQERSTFFVKIFLNFFILTESPFMARYHSLVFTHNWWCHITIIIKRLLASLIFWHNYK